MTVRVCTIKRPSGRWQRQASLVIDILTFSPEARLFVLSLTYSGRLVYVSRFFRALLNIFAAREHRCISVHMLRGCEAKKTMAGLCQVT